MMALTPKIRQQYKALAHKLRPVVMIGNKGLTETIHQEIDRALFDHELIKIRIQMADRHERRAAFSQICEQHCAQPVQLIGNIGTLYRKSDKAAK